MRTLFPAFRAVPLLICALALTGTTAAKAQVSTVDWETVTSGSLAGTTVTLSGLSSPFLSIDVYSYNSPDFAAAPVVDVESIQYGANNNWTATFSRPVTGLLLYVDFWRGAFDASGGPTVQYTFDRDFTILSGIGNSSVSGQTLLLPGDRFYEGILQFSGTFSSLTVRTLDANDESGQNLTFALPTEVQTAAPEPGTLTLLMPVLGGVGMVIRRRRSR